MLGLNEAQSSTARTKKDHPVKGIDQAQSMVKVGKPTANTISAILFSHFGVSSSCTTDSAPSNHGKKKSTAFRGLGCAAGVAEKVSVPAVRSSGEWEERKRMKKKDGGGANVNSNIICKQKKKSGGGESERIGGNFVSGESSNSNITSVNCVTNQDIWCGPGIGFSADDAVARPPVEKDCIISRRVVAGGRGKSAGEKFNSGERDREREREKERERDRERSRYMERERERERSYFCARRSSINPNGVPFWESEHPLVASRAEPELYGSRYYRHVRQPSPDELAEVVMLHGGFMVGALLDRFSDWRLDIDEMSHEQLVELSDRIGYVNTGLKEEEIIRCIKKVKLSVHGDKSHLSLLMKEKKCIICQEEFEPLDDMGKLDCGHGFHVQCLKQWLGHKKCCPICKTELESR